MAVIAPEIFHLVSSKEVVVIVQVNDENLEVLVVFGLVIFSCRDKVKSIRNLEVREEIRVLVSSVKNTHIVVT